MNIPRGRWNRYPAQCQRGAEASGRSRREKERDEEKTMGKRGMGDRRVRRGGEGKGREGEEGREGEGTKLLAGETDGGGVDDGSKVFNLLEEERVEERLVVVAHVRQIPAATTCV